MNTTTVLPERVFHLGDEHRDALARCSALGDAIASFDAAPSRERAADARKLIEWFEGAFSRHMAKEDAALIPVLETAMGQWCSLPAWMKRDHDDLRAAIRAAAAALRAAERAPDGGTADVRREADRLRSLLMIHLHREDEWLMPVARAVLSQAQWDEIARQLGRARA